MRAASVAKTARNIDSAKLDRKLSSSKTLATQRREKP
jgi:hypothetical protein